MTTGASSYRPLRARSPPIQSTRPSWGCSPAATAVTSTNTAASSGGIASAATATTPGLSCPPVSSITPAAAFRCAENTSRWRAPTATRRSRTGPLRRRGFSNHARARSHGTNRSRTAVARIATAILTRGPSAGTAPTATTKTAGTSSTRRSGSATTFTMPPGFRCRASTAMSRARAATAVHRAGGGGPGFATVQFKGLAFRKCGDCHPDGHQGQLAARAGAGPADCGECHTVSGFSPARFELEEHNKTGFPLAGSHRATACRSCHLVDAQLGKRVDPGVRAKSTRQRRSEHISLAVMRPKQAPGDCSDCHRDPHQGQFAAQIAADDCAACHTTESFSKVNFDHDREVGFR